MSPVSTKGIPTKELAHLMERDEVSADSGYWDIPAINGDVLVCRGSDGQYTVAKNKPMDIWGYASDLEGVAEILKKHDVVVPADLDEAFPAIVKHY